VRFRSNAVAETRGLVFVMFPEGGRSDDGSLQTGEPGVALIISKSGASVVPTAIIGAFEMLPVGANRLKRCKLKVVFGDPLFFTADTPRVVVIDTIMQTIGRLIAEHS